MLVPLQYWKFFVWDPGRIELGVIRPSALPFLTSFLSVFGSVWDFPSVYTSVDGVVSDFPSA